VASTAINNLGDGMDWSNVWLEYNNRELMYCAPKELALGAKEYNTILQSYLMANANLEGSNPLGLTLLMYLEERFP
jgi:hypothetical protein